MVRKFIFSIIIPSHNRAHLLEKTIDSVINQTYQNWECIVVDDGSTDNTEEVVTSIKDSRIKYFYKKNEERSIARNFGIERAKGKYICFLDSDDLYFPNHLATLYAKIEEEDFPVGIFNSGMYESRGETKVERPIYNSAKYRHPIYFIWEKFLLPTSVCVHREILEHHQFPKEYNVWEDTHLWLRVAAEYPFYQIEDVTTQWNIHEDGSVAKAFSKVESTHVKNYLNCISDLFKNYRELLKPFLNEKDRKAYQLKKLKMFFGLAFHRKQYTTCIDLYFYGLKVVERKKLTLFAYQLISGKIKGKLRAIKKRI